VCARLDGIPLAIELAAARVRAMTIEQISGGLDDRFRLLTGGARTVLPRQQTLQASVDWGYALLSDAERVVFRRLAVFAGGFSLDAAERVVAGDGVEAVQVLDLLLGLVDKSMVLADDTGRSLLLETLRQYGAARLLDAGETPAVRDRHLAWAGAVRDPIEDGLRALRIDAAPDVEVEIDNLRAAFEWAVLRDSADEARRIAATLARWEATAGDRGEAVNLASRALRIDGGNRGLRLLVTSTLLLAHFERGNYDGLRPTVDAMVDELGELDDDRVRCLCLYRAGFLYSWMRSNTKAIECYRAAGQLAAQLRQPEMGRNTDVGIAIVHAIRGDWRQAEHAVPPLDDADPMLSIAAVNTDIVHMLIGLQTGRFDEARRRTDRVASLAGRHTRVAAVAQARRAEIDLATGSDSGAHDALRGLLEESRRRRSTLTLQMSGWVPGGWALHNGDIATAVSELKAWRSEGVISVTQPAVLAHALLAAGDSQGARADLATYRATYDLGPLDEARVSLAEGLVSRAEGDVAAAETRHYAVLADAHAAGWRPLVAHSLEALAGTAAAHQSFAECVRLAGAAQALRDEMGYVLRWPFEQRLLDADLAAARARLGEDAFTTAYAEGRGLDEDAAVAYATRARGERRRPAHGWDSLTATEANVARLAAAGLTNKQIAERLLMGAETVKTHMARVYDKLDVHTRARLTTAVTNLTTPPPSSFR
jgi:DNA-binding CsgD family transcriptional regulator